MLRKRRRDVEVYRALSLARRRPAIGRTGGIVLPRQMGRPRKRPVTDPRTGLETPGLYLRKSNRSPGSIPGTRAQAEWCSRHSSVSLLRSCLLAT